MNLKRWLFGLLVASITGLLTAFTVGAIVPTMTLKEGALVCLGIIAKDLLLYMKQHPPDDVEIDSAPKQKDQPQ